MFLLYDFEVFEKDWLVVFKVYNGDFEVIVNDPQKLKEFFESHKQKYVFVGFNSRHYDEFILKGILSDLDPKRISDWIIVNKKNGWKFPGLKSIFFNGMDLRSDIEGALQISLKEIESNLGLDIQETSVPFDIKRKLTDQEIEDVIKYCKHDVYSTEKLMDVRSTYVKSRIQLIKEFKLPMRCLNVTNAQLTAEIMNPVKKDYDDGDWYEPPKELQLNNQQIMNFYTPPLRKTEKLNIDICGVPHKLGFGGLHGAVKKKHYDKNIYNFDVASYYPSMIIKFDWMCRGVKDRNKYKNIRDQRFEYKHQKDSRADSFKLILNTLSGAMDSEYNKLHDSRQCNQIRISGQLFLLDLLEKLNPYINLIQSNTDGIMFQTTQLDVCQQIVHEWENRTGMTMECDEVAEVYQKDVNGYIALSKNGEIKTKGSYVKNYSVKFKNGELKEKFGDFRSNSMTILDEAIVKNLLYSIPVEDIINNCNDPMRFQITTKKGPTFIRVEWEYDGVRQVVNNVNRVFASKDDKCGLLYKIKSSGRSETLENGEDDERDNKIGSLPEKCLVFNKSLEEFDMSVVDKQWYIDKAKERINDFIGG